MPFPTVKLEGLRHIALEAADPERSAKFYNALLGLKVVHRDRGMVFLSTPGQRDLLTFQKPPRGKRPGRAGRGLQHIGFAARPGHFPRVLSRLERHGVPITAGPGERDGKRYVYFADPDGYRIEVFEM